MIWYDYTLMFVWIDKEKRKKKKEREEVVKDEKTQNATLKNQQGID